MNKLFHNNTVFLSFLQGVRVPLNEQINNHKTIISRISNILGNDSSTKELLSQCIYSVQIGSNDYFNNYFKPMFYNTSRQYTPDQFAAVLVEKYSKQIKVIYFLLYMKSLRTPHKKENIMSFINWSLLPDFVRQWSEEVCPVWVGVYWLHSRCNCNVRNQWLSLRRHVKYCCYPFQ